MVELVHPKFEYRMQVINRPDKRGGGLVLLAKATLKTKLFDSGQTRSFEYGVWGVKCKNDVISVTRIYRPPDSVHIWYQTPCS